MVTSKVERQINLVICLLSTKQYVTAEYIHRNVSGYHDQERSDEAFNRMFERDKNDLRDLGVPLVTGPSPESGIEGYRIDPDSYSLPDITLDEQEAAAIAMAAALWDNSDVSTISQTAVLKLQAAGIDVRADDEIGVAAVSQRSLGGEQSLAPTLAAIDGGQAITFTYRAGATSSGETRTLEPWGVVTHRGRWYVVGHDRGREATRTFRLSRLSDVTATGSAGVVHRPEHTDLQQIVADAVDSATGSDGRAARVWVASGRAAGLRRLATSSTPAVFDGEDGDDLVIEIRSLSTLARMILAVGPDAVVREPAELRDLVVAGLDRIGGVNA
ncbi:MULTISPECIES: helix-turn-helix transcriptional regulator [Gordonia]|uniref:Proteasome accessory factor B n=1 Tax=Gordonia sputi NBRC 100414 TaxID=1089453 RepID=H5TWI1_9ACTN|nr:MULTISPECIES: WYL domain-containing protein [Gordonia]NKY93537.1 WYL domain-containing protein [Gordonia sputi]OBA41829.1 WYL domain-containing protein [Gordonia sp. 852002-51296_SCH5728562-b]OBA60014.1 WYL domain-containing protein [Gordonia sp. 852002-10350_SCH5691597]GAB37839.1 proteasome accessory factor B [Gordonia sputi NBRC 100414]